MLQVDFVPGSFTPVFVTCVTNVGKNLLTFLDVRSFT